MSVCLCVYPISNSYVFSNRRAHHLKMLPAKIWEAIYKVFEHIDMLSIGIQIQEQLYTVIYYPPYLGSDFGVRGHVESQNDVIMSCLRLAATSNCFPHPYKHVQSVWANWYAVYWYLILVAALHNYTHTTCLRRFRGTWSLVESKWCHCIMVEVESHLKHSSRIHIRHVQIVWLHWYAVHRHTVYALYSDHLVWATEL